MGIRQTIEEHPAIIFLTIAITAFAAGWGAHVAIQAASGLVSVPAERVKQIDDYQNILADRDRLIQREAQLLDRPGFPAKILALEAERDQLRKEILLNRPTGGTYLSNIALQPKSPAILNVGDRISIDFDYLFPKGVKGGIWAHPKEPNDLRYSFDGSYRLEGTGRANRGFKVTSAGRLSKILIYVNDDDDELYSMSIPVNYLFR